MGAEFHVCPREPVVEADIELTPDFVPFLHCELQLISYLDRHNITAHMNLIGVSKLMCWACNTYVKEVNKRRENDRKEPYMLSGTSGKIPPGELRDVVVKVCNALRDPTEILGHQRIHSGGSVQQRGID